VGAFATAAPLAALKSLLEVLALAPLEKIVEYLGDHVESPTFEQLERAVDQLVASGSSLDDVVARAAYAIGESFPAAPSCRQLFEGRAELALPALAEVDAPSVLAPPHAVTPEVREQRRFRREEEKRRRKPVFNHASRASDEAEERRATSSRPQREGRGGPWRTRRARATPREVDALGVKPDSTPLILWWEWYSCWTSPSTDTIPHNPKCRRRTDPSW